MQCARLQNKEKKKKKQVKQHINRRNAAEMQQKCSSMQQKGE